METAQTTAPPSVDLAIYAAVERLLEESTEQSSDDRRSDQRRLFVHTATVTADGEALPALTRDISAEGIGLLSRSHIAPGRVQVAVQQESGGQVEFTVDLRWTRPFGNNSFLSGGRFVDAKLPEQNSRWANKT